MTWQDWKGTDEIRPTHGNSHRKKIMKEQPDNFSHSVTNKTAVSFPNWIAANNSKSTLTRSGLEKFCAHAAEPESP